MKSPTVLIIGDIHYPLHDSKAVQAAYDFGKCLKPDVLVVGGDLVDFAAISRFLHNPREVPSLQREMDGGRALLSLFSGLAKERIFVGGNHEERLEKFLLRNAPQLLELRCLDLREALGMKAWTYVPYPAFWKCGRLIVHHGVSYNGTTNAKNLAKFDGHSVAQGHSHRLSQTFHRSLHGQVSAVEWGCLCDLNPHYCHRPNWTQGVAVWSGSKLSVRPILRGKVCA